MVSKLVILSVACFAFLVQPAHSGDISSIASSAAGTAKEIVSFIPNVMIAKAGAVVRTAGDLASIFATGIGLKIKAVARGIASVKGAVADGFIDIGDSLSSGANTIAENMLVSNGGSRLAPTVVEEIKVKSPVVVEDIVVPRQQEAVEAIQVKVRPSTTIVEPAERVSFVSNKVSTVWNTLMNGAQAKVNGVGQIFTIGDQPRTYEIINSPRVFEETIRIQKK